VKVCSGCKQFHYCGKECQTSDWKEFHKHECGFYKKLADQPANWIKTMMDTNLIISLVMRAHFLFKAKPELADMKFDAHDGRRVSFSDVPDAADGSDPESDSNDEQLIHQLCKSLAQLDPQSFAGVNEKYFLPLYRRIRQCMFQTMVIIPLSVIKLSCSPNSAYILIRTGVLDKQIRLRAVRDITVGEPVTIGLSDEAVLMPKSMRQQEIRKHKSIVCECDRCKAGDQENEVKDLMFVQPLTKEFKMRMCTVTPDESWFIDHMIKDLTIKEKFLGKYHPMVTKAMFQIVNSMITTHVYWLRRSVFDDLLNRLEVLSPITHGDDYPAASIHFLHMIRRNFPPGSRWKIPIPNADRLRRG
jgi:hypothetical protein